VLDRLRQRTCPLARSVSTLGIIPFSHVFYSRLQEISVPPWPLGIPDLALLPRLSARAIFWNGPKERPRFGSAFIFYERIHLKELCFGFPYRALAVIPGFVDVLPYGCRRVPVCILVCGENFAFSSRIMCTQPILNPPTDTVFLPTPAPLDQVYAPLPLSITSRNEWTHIPHDDDVRFRASRCFPLRPFHDPSADFKYLMVIIAAFPIFPPRSLQMEVSESFQSFVSIRPTAASLRGEASHIRQRLLSIIRTGRFRPTLFCFTLPPVPGNAHCRFFLAALTSYSVIRPQFPFSRRRDAEAPFSFFFFSVDWKSTKDEVG